MRPVGQRIRQALEVVEMYGPCGYSTVATETGIEVTNAGKYCQRATALGLMTVNKPEKRGSGRNFATYSVNPNWRQMLGSFKASEPVRAKPADNYRRSIFSSVNSIFNMG